VSAPDYLWDDGDGNAERRGRHVPYRTQDRRQDHLAEGVNAHRDFREVAVRERSAGAIHAETLAVRRLGRGFVEPVAVGQLAAEGSHCDNNQRVNRTSQVEDTHDNPFPKKWLRITYHFYRFCKTRRLLRILYSIGKWYIIDTNYGFR
jgi:hypothetical protein